MAARPSAAQQRERRARIALVALLGVLVVACGVQVPRLLHRGGSSAPSSASVASSAPAGTALVSAVTAGSTAAHLTRFAVKDPFHPLVRTAPSSPGGAAANPKPSSATRGGSARAAEPTPATKPAAHLSTLTVPFATPRPTGKPGALVVLDGRRLKLLPGDLIPQAAPILRVVATGPKRVLAKLLTGTLADGSTAVALPLHRKLVLRNTTDGTTFVLRYLAPTLVPPRATPPPAS